jgi:hypothetical protein
MARDVPPAEAAAATAESCVGLDAANIDEAPLAFSVRTYPVVDCEAWNAYTGPTTRYRVSSSTKAR